MSTLSEHANNIQGTSARTINLCIGAIAMLLGPGLVLVGYASSRFDLSFIPGPPVAPSISDYYYFNDITRNIFVGALCAIGLLISAYRGWRDDNAADRVIAVTGFIAAWAVAMAPCKSELKPLHFLAAAVLFGLMAIMLRYRFTEPTGDPDETAHPGWKAFRNRIYRWCSNVMLVAMAARALTMLPNVTAAWNTTFWVEVVGLSAFSLGWLTKSRYLFGYRRSDGVMHLKAK
jgi:hypothetical protein